MSDVADRYAVMGNPIAHSKSPQIHGLFAEQTQQNLTYEACLVDTSEGAFAQAVAEFRAANGQGLNVTVPFKQDAWQLADERSAHAEKAGAVNTLWFRDGSIMGDNTDGVGLVRDLTQNYNRTLRGKSVLMLGAGGAVRGVLGAFLAAEVSMCVIANRTESKAVELAQLFQDEGETRACSYADLAGQQFDLIINGTSASLQGELPPLPQDLFTPNGWAYDLMYAATPTPFVQWALGQGAACALDGLGMLVEQAAESFYIWRGVRPDTAPVIAQLRQAMKASVAGTEALNQLPLELGGRQGLEPVRYGDWEKSGRCIDF